MIFLSLNLRGVGGSLKMVYVRRLLYKTRLDIILLQENLVLELKARTYMSGLRPSWVIRVVNSMGTSKVSW